MLFQELDVNKDGMLDEFEFEQLFYYQLNSSAMKQMDSSPMRESMGEEKIGNYMQGGYNTYNKKPLERNEMLQLPTFCGQVRHKLEMRRRGKEVGLDAQRAFM